MDGCQECLRESRGDRVMSHDERTCTEASTWHAQILLSWQGQYVRRVYGRWYLFLGMVLLLWRLFGLQCSISRTTSAAASRTSTSRSSGRIATPVGVGILQAFLICTSPLLSFISQSGISLHLSAASATARSHKVVCIGGRARVSHQPGLFFSTFCFLGSQSQGGESNSSGPTPVHHQGRRRSVRWTECVTFPSGQGCACQASFLTGHTQCPRHKKVSVHTRQE